jgi:hypothetical protein
MGMPCEVNSILKLKNSNGYPNELKLGIQYEAWKENYRIIPVDVPIALVDENWIAYADVIITKLIWEKGNTHLFFTIDRIYKNPFITKEINEQ